MKILYVSTIVSTMVFFPEHFKMLIDKGHCIEIACNCEGSVPKFCEEMGIKVLHIPFSRSPLAKENLTALKQLRALLKEEHYDIIHCHTPVAAMMTRLAARKVRKKGTKVVYTAHGFHFFKGAPLINWLIYYPVEWICSFMTDVLITMNQEDFAFAKKHLHARRTEYVHGVGANSDKIKNVDVYRNKKRAEIKIPPDSIAVLSVGELNINKNHDAVLRAIASLNRRDLTYVICGRGNKGEQLKSLAKELGMEDRLILLGFRPDVPEIYKCCDIFAFPSFREGLPVSVMEAMLAGLPVVGSDIRGIRDLTSKGKNGFLYKPMDIQGFAEGIERLANDSELRRAFGEFGKETVVPFTIENVKTEMQRIYDSL